MKPFGDFPPEFCTEKDSKIVILPIPYDGTSSGHKGADKGPEALLEASALMWHYDIETDSDIYKNGIFTAPPVLESSSPEAMSEAVYNATKKYLNDGKFVVGLGGEHSVSIGAIKAHSEKYRNLTVLQFDAHLDLLPEFLGSSHNHACIMARAQEVAKTVHVGIRSIDREEKKMVEADRIFYAHQIHFHRDWFEKVIEKLSNNVYVTIDLDVFDPSLMPSTGTPEPGGLQWYDVLDLLKLVFRKCNVVGADVVELCPNETNKTPDYTAAKLVYKLLGYKFDLK